MSKKTGIFKSYAVYDLILIAMLCALSIAIKTIAGALVRMITGSLGIPGGALAGGFYMMWLPLAIALTGRRGAALIVAAVQTIVMITARPAAMGCGLYFRICFPQYLWRLYFL